MEGEQGRERGVWPISMLDKALTEWREKRGEGGWPISMLDKALTEWRENRGEREGVAYFDA